MKKNYSTNENCFCPNCKNYRIQKYGGKIKTKRDLQINTDVANAKKTLTQIA